MLKKQISFVMILIFKYIYTFASCSLTVLKNASNKAQIKQEERRIFCFLLCQRNGTSKYDIFEILKTQLQPTLQHILQHTQRLLRTCIRAHKDCWQHTPPLDPVPTNDHKPNVCPDWMIVEKIDLRIWLQLFGHESVSFVWVSRPLPGTRKKKSWDSKKKQKSPGDRQLIQR